MTGWLWTFMIFLLVLAYVDGKAIRDLQERVIRLEMQVKQ